jgi:hypothetical protein
MTTHFLRTLACLACICVLFNGCDATPPLPKISRHKKPTASRNDLATKTSIATSKVGTEIADNVRKSRIQRFVDKQFDKTDEDHDGTVSFQEAYEGVLKFYITLNRQAPIPPPSRDKVRLLYNQADKTHNNKLDRGEYGKLLERTMRRAFVRLAVHKSVTILGAPLLAEVIVRKLAAKKEWIERVCQHIVPLRFQDKMIPIFVSSGFHRALWIMIFVATLGKQKLDTLHLFAQSSPYLLTLFVHPAPRKLLFECCQLHTGLVFGSKQRDEGRGEHLMKKLLKTTL